jgi:hypothetical protein
MYRSLLLVVLVVTVTGCKQSQNSSNTNTAAGTSPMAGSATAPPSDSSNQLPGANAEKAQTDACALLNAEEVKAVQGEVIRETKLSARSDGGFNISQCFFTLPTFTNSISLSVTARSSGNPARDPKEFWEETFHRDEEMKREGEREEREGEEEDEAKPQKVNGVGDEAFWMGSRVGGALYVLKGDTYIRISIGGAGDQESKIRKCKVLAQKAIARL